MRRHARLSPTLCRRRRCITCARCDTDAPPSSTQHRSATSLHAAPHTRRDAGPRAVHSPHAPTLHTPYASRPYALRLYASRPYASRPYASRPLRFTPLTPQAPRFKRHASSATCHASRLTRHAPCATLLTIPSPLVPQPRRAAPPGLLDLAARPSCP
eukprot:4214116-Prymnesium_polylepis.1